MRLMHDGISAGLADEIHELLRRRPHPARGAGDEPGPAHDRAIGHVEPAHLAAPRPDRDQMLGQDADEAARGEK